MRSAGSHDPASKGNVRSSDSEKAMVCDNDDDDGFRDGNSDQELTGLMSLVTYDSMVVVAASDDDNHCDNNRRRRRNVHDADESSSISGNYDVSKTARRPRTRCRSLVNRDNYRLLSPDFEEKVYMAAKSTVTSDFGLEVEEKNQGIKTRPWKLEQDVLHEHELLYPEAGEDKREDGHNPGIKLSGRHSLKFELLQEKKGVFQKFINWKKRFTGHLINRDRISKRKNRYSDSREKDSPLQLPAIKNRIWQVMIRKRLTSSRSSTSSQEAAIGYCHRAEDEDSQSLAVKTTRAVSCNGGATQYITRSPAINSQEYDASLSLDYSQQERTYASRLGKIVPYLSFRDYMNHNRNNVASSSVSSTSKSSILTTPMVSRSGNGLVSNYEKGAIETIKLASESVEYVSKEQGARKAVEMVREECFQIKLTDEGFDMRNNKGLDCAERPGKFARHFLFWNWKKLHNQRKKEGKRKHITSDISSVQKKRDALAPPSHNNENVITSRRDNGKTMQKAEQHGNLSIKKRSKRINSKLVGQDEQEENEAAGLKGKMLRMETVKPVNKTTEARQSLQWACLASRPLLQEFQEAVEKAHLQMRMLAGFLALEKDTEIVVSHNISGAESAIDHHHHHGSNAISTNNVLEDQRNHAFTTIIEAGIQISTSSICFLRPWHMKYALDACVNSIFFKLNLHQSSKERNSSCNAECGGISSSMLSSAPLDAMCCSLEYNWREGFGRFLSSKREATEELVGIEMGKWSDSLRSMFFACAVSCFHVYTLITEGSRSCSVRILHPLYGHNFDEPTMDPLDSLCSSTEPSIKRNHRAPKVLFTIFSGFALNIDGNGNDDHQDWKLLCKPQVYLSLEAASRGKNMSSRESTG